MERSNWTRLHDLKGVYTDFKIVFRLIKSGYRFDDADAPPVMEQLEKALSKMQYQLNTLEREIIHSESTSQQQY
jgi:hypothetical protein